MWTVKRIYIWGNCLIWQKAGTWGYGRIGSGAEGFKGPRGRNCNRRLSNCTESCSSCKSLQLAAPSGKATVTMNTITITMKSILLLEKLAMSSKNSNVLQFFFDITDRLLMRMVMELACIYICKGCLVLQLRMRRDSFFLTMGLNLKKVELKIERIKLRILINLNLGHQPWKRVVQTFNITIPKCLRNSTTNTYVSVLIVTPSF